MDFRLQAVRELWGAYNEQGVEAAIALLDPEVEFVDHQGRSFLGHDGVRRFFGEFEERRERFAASAYSFELHEPDLIVIGHRRIRSDDGLRGDLLFFVHSFNGHRVCRIAALTTKEAALADIEARAGT